MKNPKKEVEAVAKEPDSFHLGFSFLLSNKGLHTVKGTDRVERSVPFEICSSF